jgi:hypothetical protein
MTSPGNYTPSVRFGGSGGGPQTAAERRPFGEVGKVPLSLFAPPTKTGQFVRAPGEEQKPTTSMFSGVPLVGPALGFADDLLGKVSGIPGSVFSKALWAIAPDNVLKHEIAGQARAGQLTQDEAEAYYVDRFLAKNGTPGFIRNLAGAAVSQDMANSSRIAMLGLGTLDVGYNAMETLRAQNDPNRLPALLHASDKDLQNNTELIRIRDELAAGTITSSEAIDGLVDAGFATSNPLDPAKSGLGTLAGDPLNWLSFGSAALAGVSSRFMRGVARLGTTHLGEEVWQTTAMRVIKDLAEGGKTQVSESDVVHQLAFNKKYADVYDQLRPHLSPTQRWMVEVAPVVVKAGKLIDEVLDPLTILNRSGARNLSVERAAMDAGQAAVDEFGTKAYYDVKSTLLTELGEKVAQKFDDGYARATQQVLVQVGAGELSKNAIITQSLNGVEGAFETAAQSRARALGGGLQNAVREHVGRVRRHYVPTERGVAGLKQMRHQMEDLAARQVVNLAEGAVDMDRALAIVRGMSEDQLALLDYNHFGTAVGDFLDARAKATVAHNAALRAASEAAKQGGKGAKGRVARLRQLRSMAPVDRLTFLGPRQATKKTVREMMAILEDRTLSEEVRADRLREYVRTYDDLWEAFAVDPEAVSSGRLLNVLRRNLPSVMESLPEHIDDVTLLPDYMRQWLGRYETMGYRVALKPSEQFAWRAVWDDAGRLVSVKPWVDYVTGKTVAPEMSRVRNVTDFMFRSVSGEAVLRESRNRFVRQMGERLGIAEGTSRDLFSNLIETSRIAELTPRAMSERQVMDTISKMALPPSVKNDLTNREVVHAWWLAHEGSLKTVGVTQKLSGRIKSLEVTRLGTAGVSAIAERIYPLTKFAKNPFFQFQELLETPFLLMLRGYIPMSDMVALLPTARGAAKRESIAAEVQQSMFVMERLAKKGSLLDAAEQSMLYIFSQRAVDQAYRRSGLIGRLPDVGYVKQWGVTRSANHQWTRDIDNVMKAASPEAHAAYAKWLTYKGKYGHNAAQAMAFDVIARSDPDSVYSTLGKAALTPQFLGKRAAVSTRLLRTLATTEAEGLEMSWKKFRQRLRDPNDPLTITDTIDALRATGADEDYIGRAGAMMSAPDEDEWFKTLANLGRTKPELEAIRKSYQREADALGLELDEYIGRQWAGLPADARHIRDVDGGWNFQVITDSLRDKGFDVPPLDDPRYAEMDDYLLQQLPQLTPKAPGTPGKMTPEQAKAQEAVRGRQKREADAEVGKPREAYGNLPREIRDADGRLIHVFGRPSFVEWMEMAQNVLGDRAILEHADWYPDMRQAFMALNGGDPQAAAREMLAFGMSQMRASPYAGYRHVRRQMERLARGQADLPALKAERTALFGFNAEAIQNVLAGGPPSTAGLGQKLLDFIDSLRGVERRSVGQAGPNGSWQPSAFDVWMKRDFGFLDNEAINKVRHVLGAKAVTWDDATGYHIEMPDGTTYDVPVADVQQGAPSDVEYDYGIEFANDLKDHLNSIGWKDKRDWKAWDVQAIGWFRAKRAMGDETGTPTETFFRYSTNVSFEAVPHPNSPLGELFPEIDDPVWDRVPPVGGVDARRYIMDAVERFNVAEVEALTGIRTVVRAPIQGTWQSGQQVPGMVYEVVGTDETIKGVISALAYMNHQAAVAGSRIAPGVRKTVAKPGQVWAVDWSADGMTRQQAQNTLDYLVQKGDPTVIKGSTLVTYDDGSWGVRSMYLDLMPEEGRNVTLSQFRTALPDEAITEVENTTVTRYVVDSFYADTPATKASRATFGKRHLQNVRTHLGAEVADQLVNLVEPRSRQFYEFAHRRAMGEHLADWRVSRTESEPGYLGAIAQYLDPTIGDDEAVRRAVDAAGVGRAAGTPYFQRAARGVYGATSFLDDGRSVLALNSLGTRDDTVLHELGHKWVQDYLDPSGEQMVVDLYNDAVAGGRIRGKRQTVTVEPTPEEMAPYNAYLEEQAQYERDLAAFEQAQAERAGRPAPVEGPDIEELGARFRNLLRKYDEADKMRPQQLSRELERLSNDVDVGYELDTLSDWPDRADFSDAEEFRDAKEDLWREVLDSLESKGDPDTLSEFLLREPSEGVEFAPVAPVPPTPVEPPGPRTTTTRTGVEPAETFDERVHEWFVNQYVEWVHTGRSPQPSMDGLFDFYSDFIKRTAERPELEQGMASFLVSKTRGGPKNQSRRGFNYNPDEKALFDVISVNARQASRNAEDLIHFRTNRSWLERSMNHPYLGLYPLSYMWGKVLPELVEFMAFRPFGIKAPFATFAMAQRMAQQVALQTEYDPELNKFLEDNEPALRAIAFLVPGVPWDLPVNAPLWSRRMAEGLLTQQKRVMEGATNPDGTPAEVDLTKLDFPRIVGETAGYALNPVRGFETLGDTWAGVTSLPSIAAGVATGDYGTDDDGATITAPLTTEEQSRAGGGVRQAAANVRADTSQAPVPTQAQPTPPGTDRRTQPDDEPDIEGVLQEATEEVTEALGGG